MSTYQAYGYTLSIDASGIKAQPNLLHASLGHSATTITQAAITGCQQLHAAGTFTPGQLAIDYIAADTTQRLVLDFAPQTQAQLEVVAQAVAACMRGEAPASEITGLDFVAVDVETANPDWGSICQIGVVKVRNGVVVQEESWLCQPAPAVGDFDPEFEKIHGITPAAMADAPGIAQVLPEFFAFCEDLPLVAHNAAFDIGAIFRAAQLTGVTIPTLRYGCTLTLARLQLQLNSYRLPVVAEHFGVTLSQHHDALADARAAAEIMIGFAKGHNAAKADQDSTLEQVSQALGAQLGTLQAERYYPVLRTAQVAPARPAAQNSANRSGGNKAAAWKRVATPEAIPEPALDADPTNPLYGQNVTISGEFTPFDKGEIWEALAAHGATIGKNVTKKTTILACGTWEGKTSKQKRAEELQEKGQDIAIWDAAQLLDVLDLDSSTS